MVYLSRRRADGLCYPLSCTCIAISLNFGTCNLWHTSTIIILIIIIIKIYGSTSHVGIGCAQNGVLYVRYRTNSMITTAEQHKVLADKKTLLFYHRSCSQSSANLSQSWEKRTSKFQFSSLFSLARNSKNIVHIQKFWISNKCSTIAEVPFFLQ